MRELEQHLFVDAEERPFEYRRQREVIVGQEQEPAERDHILDLAAVSSGFVLRAVAGGVAAGVPLSNWFLIVASFGSLLIVTQSLTVTHLKRHAGTPLGSSSAQT